MTKFGRHVVSKCMCCSKPAIETIHHLFMDSEATHIVWNYLGTPLGIRDYTSLVNGYLRTWWQ